MFRVIVTAWILLFGCLSDCALAWVSLLPSPLTTRTRRSLPLSSSRGFQQRLTDSIIVEKTDTRLRQRRQQQHRHYSPYGSSICRLYPSFLVDEPNSSALLTRNLLPLSKTILPSSLIFWNRHQLVSTTTTTRMSYDNNHNRHKPRRTRIESCTKLSSTPRSDNGDDNNNDKNDNLGQRAVTTTTFLEQVTVLTPLWTVLAAGIACKYATRIGPILGSVSVVSSSLFVLMLAMALSTTPAAFLESCRKSFGILLVNALCCFGIMPGLAILVAKIVGGGAGISIGTILLGCVSGGQASNLFALLAGGDVSLSVVSTLSTTILGVFLTPLLVQSILSNWKLVSKTSAAAAAATVITVDGLAVLNSIIKLVLGPLLLGLGIGALSPPSADKIMTRIRKEVCPIVGIMATLILVAGGAANTVLSSGGIGSLANRHLLRPLVASILLPLAGGTVAWFIAIGLSKITAASKKSSSSWITMDEPIKRTLVVEVLSKSPTLAYVLARTHFESSTGATSVPAAAMVSLAVVGALVASFWSRIPIKTTDK